MIHRLRVRRLTGLFVVLPAFAVIALLTAVGGVGAAASPTAGVELPAGFYLRTSFTGLAAPTDMTAMPDGRLLVTEKGTGRDEAALAAVRLIDDQGVRDEPVLTLSVNSAGDSGLLAIALDANFAANGYYYLYYATGKDAQGWTGATSNRLSRFTFDFATAQADPASELMLIDAIPWSIQHNGGGLAVDQQGLLYLAIGDTLQPEAVDDLTQLHGKLLRLRPDAAGYTVPADNPFVNEQGALPEIYARGLRSPFRLALGAAAGEVYVADVGGGRWEEVNRIAAGAHFGWPEREGPCPNGRGLPCPETPARYTDPIIYYAHPPAQGGVPVGSSLTGMAVYTDETLPPQFHGGFFLADLNRGTIGVATDDEGGFTLAPFAANLPGLVDLEFVAGELYYLHIFDGTVGVISHSDVLNRIPVMTLRVDPHVGPAPLQVRLDATGSYDPDENAFVYTWDFGDDSPIYVSSTPVVTHTYTVDANYRVQLQGLDVNGGVSVPVAQTISVYSDELPQIELRNLTESDRAAYHAGDTWQYVAVRGAGLDGLDPVRPFSWDIYLHHNQHAHPILQGNVAVSDTFVIDTDNHDSEWNLWYRLALTMRTADGQEIVVDRLLEPAFVNLTVSSEPSGQTLQLNNITISERRRLKTIVGMEHTLVAPAQIVHANGVGVFDHWYIFADGWPVHAADNGGRIVATPLTDTTYTAYYRFERPARTIYLPRLAR